MSAPKNVATLLVEIAMDIFMFGCATERRRRSGDPAPVTHTFASPKNNPDIKRPLPDIRSDLAELYTAMYGTVPNASALGDAMTVLEAKANKAAPVETDPDTMAALIAFGGKANIATRLVEMAKERFSFAVTTTGEAFAVPVDGPNVARVLRGGRRSLRSELARIFFEETKSAANAQALADALLVLEGEAQGLDPVEVALRVGRASDGRLVLDLGSEDGRAVVIGPSGWELVDTSPVLFWRTNATLSLPTPDSLGKLDDLRDLLNVSEDSWPLIVAWMVAALMPEMPHPVLLLKGEHGTAKSSAARLVTSLIDRCASQLRTAPRNVEDWAVAAAGSWVTCLDNVSNLQHWLQDAICRGVTGDGLLRRQRYTDSDVTVLAFRRVLALTSVDPGALNGDLADRLLTVELERIAEGARTSEEDLAAVWASLHPGVLGGLLDVAVQVLGRLQSVRRTGLPRMADFARVLLTVDEVLGTTGYETYTEQAANTAETVADGDPVAIAIREKIKEEWSGTANGLLAFLAVDQPPRDWPATPQAMGGRLVRVAPTLVALGWTAEKLPRSGSSRTWRLAPPADHQDHPDEDKHREHPDLDEDEEVPAGSSWSSQPSASTSQQQVSDDSPGDNLAADDMLTGFAEGLGSDVGPGIAAGHDDHDNHDIPAGTRSVCLRCGNPLYLVLSGRDTCEPCRIATARETP